MAYVTQERNRTATLAAVGALHVAAIYALVTGLAGPVWEAVSDSRTAATNIPIPQVPTEPIEQPATKPTTAPAGSLDDKTSDNSAITVVTTTFPTTGGESTSPVGGAGTSEGTGSILDKPVQQTIDPVFPPKLARPIGKPGLWVTTNDYPASALRMGHEGVTRFQLSIGTDGKVQSCEVTMSSGHAALDQAACANLRQRGKFVAATGPDGGAVPGSYSSAVRWTLPKDY
jgi:protein TonB